MDDFPAAHSMDTTWFAVDRDGHVACFDSGEAGAVPAGAFGGDAAYEVRERLAQFLPRGEAAFDLAGRQVPGTEGKAVWHRTGDRDLNYPALLFLKSLDPVKEALASGQAVQVASGDSFAVTFQHLPAKLGRRIHDADACLMCFYLWRSAAAVEPARLGFFEYEHLTENWVSGPYGRTARPLQPLHVDQLPPDVRELVKQMRFDNLSFAQATHVQPVEHAECVSWESAYLDVTGKKIRPIPGREEGYAGAVEQLEDLGREGIEVEPPGAEGEEGAEP
jgi:hypothetical protein